MLNLLNWEKPLEVNGKLYQNSTEAYEELKDFEGDVVIKLNPRKLQVIRPAEPEPEPIKVDEKIYKIAVRQYMTKPFDFHEKWNQGHPMPMRVMVGTILKETAGMYKMKLWAKPMPASVCMVCGRTLTHPVSLHYGIGPECGKHFHINPYETEEELQAEYEHLRDMMANIVWEGWVIKKAIESMETINN